MPVGIRVASKGGKPESPTNPYFQDSTPLQVNLEQAVTGPSASDRLMSDRFLVRRRLGAGAFGVVYEVFDRNYNARVAAKILYQNKPSVLYRFKQEFRLLTDIVHPNLVTLYELLSVHSRWLITMELIEGKPFFEHFRRGSPPGPPAPLDEHRLRATFLLLARAVHALHGAGILHRDIKPSNVLVTETGRVVVLDFGLAKQLLPSPTQTSPGESPAGSPAYMAPEQWTRQPLTEATDWYSVGVMLYEALSGQRPFVDESPRHLISAKHAGVLFLSERVAGVPPELEELCVRLLEPDPAARPSGEEVLRYLGEPQHSAGGLFFGPSTAREPALVGRARHLELLREAFRESQSGRAVLVQVSGRAGLGKTALLQAFLSELRERREAQVLSARCHENEAVPYKGLDGLMDALGRYLYQLPREEAAALLPYGGHELARLFPVLRLRAELFPETPLAVGGSSSDPRETRWRTLRVLKELLTRLASRQPLVLCIDDVHWADVDSAQALAELLAPPAVPLLLLLSYRAEELERSAFLLELRRFLSPLAIEARLRELPVERLSPEDTRELALALLGSTTPQMRQLAEQLSRESEGNPLLVEELARHLRDSGSGWAEATLPARELTLAGMLRTRIQQLPEHARRLLEVVSVAGRPLARRIAVKTAELGDLTPSSVTLLRAGRLLRLGAGAQEELEIAHDRIRESVVAGLDAPRLAAWHLRLARVLEAQPVQDAEALAFHFHGAGLLREASLQALRAAERALEVLAFDRAARFLGYALEWGETAAEGPLPNRHELRLKRAEALANAGRAQQAAEAWFQLADEGGPEETSLEFQRRGVELLLSSGHVDAGLARVSPLLEKLQLQHPRTPLQATLRVASLMARLKLRGLDFQLRAASEVDARDLLRIDFCRSLGKALQSVDGMVALSLQLRGLLLALEAGEPVRVAQGLILFGSLWLWQGTPRTVEKGTRLLERGAALARQLQHPALLGLTQIYLYYRSTVHGDWDTGLEHLDAGFEQLRGGSGEYLWERNMAHCAALVTLDATGRYQELRAQAAELYQRATQVDDLYLRITAALSSGVALLAAGEGGEARERIRETLSAWSHRAFHIQHLYGARFEIQAELYDGRPEVAWELLAGLWPELEASRLLRAQIIRLDMHFLRARVALALAEVKGGQHRSALRVAERDASLLERELRRDAKPLALLIRAGHARLRGRPEQALSSLSLAAEHFLATHMPVHAACAHYHLGRLLGADEGHVLLERAHRALAQEGIREPARFVAMLAPGFAVPRATERETWTDTSTSSRFS